MSAGVAMFDYDRDGRMDLFFTNGASVLDPMPKGKMPEKTEPKFWNRLYHQKADGTFEDATEKSGLKGDGYSFGAAVGDFDRDGFEDLLVTKYGGANLFRNNGDTDIVIAQTDGAPVVLRNNGTRNHWLGVDLRGGEKSAPDGECSRVIVTDANDKRQVFDVSKAGSYLSANDSRVVVGLGASASVKSVEVRWTSGKVERIENSAIDRYQIIKEKQQ